ncbi:MAG: hypothetical protein LBB19_04050 [Puniceicoccales bacterium]|jgi:hypothetical protein|nr:hypothetical protein [Puniceicoccales bacterium]
MFQFLFGIFLFCTKLVFACGFPVSTTCSYESLPPHIRNLHARLFHAASLAGLSEGINNEKNYFACALVIYFKDGTHTEIPINPGLFPSPPRVRFPVALQQHTPIYNEDWWVFFSHEPPPKSSFAHPHHTILMNLWQLIEECMTHPFDSLSQDLQPDCSNFHAMLATPENVYIKLSYKTIPARGCRYPDANYSCFYLQDTTGKRMKYKPKFSLQSRFFQLLAQYFYNQPQIQNEQNVEDIQIQDIIRAADSEAWAIGFLHAYCKKIGGLIREQQKGRKIVGIELHGHTTRDMCPFCFTHINLLQWLANNNPRVGHFFSDLMFQLSIDGNVPVTTFISSAVQFPDSSRSWFHEFITPQEGYRLQSVNLFRLLDNPPDKEIPVPIANRFGALMPVFSLYGNHPLALGEDSRFKETQGSMMLNALDLKVYENTLGEPGQFKVQSHVSAVPMYVYLYFPPSRTKMIWKRQDKPFPLPYVPGLLSTVSLNLPRIREFFTLQDVPPDGNCGVWALLQGMNPDINYLQGWGARMEEMQDLRAQVATAVDTTIPRVQRDVIVDRIGTPAARPGDVAHWITTEDFEHFARALQRPIGVIVAGNGFRFFDAGGVADDPTQFTLENFVNRLNLAANPLVVYAEPGHYQTVTEVRAPGGATWSLPPAPAPQAPVDDEHAMDRDDALGCN